MASPNPCSFGARLRGSATAQRFHAGLCRLGAGFCIRGQVWAGKGPPSASGLDLLCHKLDGSFLPSSGSVHRSIRLRGPEDCGRCLRMRSSASLSHDSTSTSHLRGILSSSSSSSNSVENRSDCQTLTVQLDLGRADLKGEVRYRNLSNQPEPTTPTGQHGI